MGAPLGPYDLIDRIGKGGMGIVWRATHRASGTHVAVKVLRARNAWDPTQVDLFEREVRAAAALHHPGIAMVLDYGIVPAETHRASRGEIRSGSPFLVMELVTGGTLFDRKGTMPWGELRPILHDLLAALGHAHARGVIHRDIKPGNILLAGSDDPRRGPRFTDFGIARLQRRIDAVESETAFVGSPSYVPPEQIEGRMQDIGPWSDLYALGCTAWAVLCGTAPWTGAMVDILAGHLDGDLPPLEPRSPVPSELRAWLAGLIRPRAADRFQCAADAAVALDGVGNRRRRRPAALRPWEDLEPALPPVHLSGVGLELLGLRRVPMVGRRHARGELWDALREVTGEQAPRVVIVRGPPGSGKSRLAEWVSERAEEQGVARALRAVHSAVPGPHDGMGPLLARALRCFGLDRAAALPRVAARLRSLGGVLPWLWAAASEIATEGAPEPTVSGVRLGSNDRLAVLRACLRLESARRPLVLWLDDVQFAPEALRLVRSLLEPDEDPPPQILAVLTVAPEILPDRPVEAALLEQLATHPQTRSLDLPPLDSVETMQLVSDLVGLEPRLAREIVQRSAGNPLFAVQLIADQVDRGTLEVRPAGFSLVRGARLEMPESLGAVWAQRIDAVTGDTLDPDEAELALEVAAALGHSFPERWWTAAVEAAGAELAPSLRARLAASDLLTRVDSVWTFRHAALRSLLERRSRQADRWKRANAACATALAADPRPDARRLGEALLAAGRRAEALEPLFEAVAVAMQHSDQVLAQTLLDAIEGTLAILTGGIDRRAARARLLRVVSLRLDGRIADSRHRATQVAEQAAARGWPALEARALRELAILDREHGDLRTAVTLLERARELFEGVGDLDGAGAVCQSAGYALRNLGRYPEAKDAFERGIAIYDELQVPWARAVCMGGLATVHLELGEVDPAERLIQDERAILEEIGNLTALSGCLINLGTVLRYRERYDAALRVLREAREVRRHLGNPTHIADVDNSLGELLRAMGRFDEAELAYRRALAAYEAHGSSWAFMPRANLGLLLLEQGRYGEARPAVEAALAEASAQGRRGAADVLSAALLPCFAHEGDWEAWERAMAPLRTFEAGSKRLDEDSAGFLTLAARLAVAAGRRREAGEARELAMAQWTALGRSDKVALLRSLAG